MAGEPERAKADNMKVMRDLPLAQRCYAFRSKKLGEVDREMGIKTHGLHRALADATITWHVLKSFILDLQSQCINTLAELIGVQGALTSPGGWYGSPALMEW